jgi:integrase
MKREDFLNRDGSYKYNLAPIDSYGPHEGITADVILDIRREKVIDGVMYFPCKFRVTFKRKQAYYPCMDLTPEQFDKLHGTVRNSYINEAKNKYIKPGFQRITDEIGNILAKEPFTLELLAKRLSRGTNDSLLSAFDKRISDLKNDGKAGSVVWYTSAMNSIKSFTKKDLKLAEITPEWLKRYEKHMLEKKSEYTTISINMRALRAIINIARRDGIISEAQYPFEVKKNGKYKIPEAMGTKRALTEDQLIKVFDYPLSASDQKYRDMWIFSFYCNGANIGDILRFKRENIKGNFIEWYRSKTIDTSDHKIKIRAMIAEEMREIIDRWGNTDKRPNAYLFDYLKPKMSPFEERMIIQNLTHCINKKMKTIGQDLGIGDITTYWARHTFASISRRKEVSLFSISKSLGHKSLSTTQTYLDSLADEEIIENASKLPRRKK